MMEAYTVMQIMNGALLMICMTLAGALWKNLRDGHKETKDDVKSLFKLISKQQEQLSETLSLAKLNQQAIDNSQKLLRAHIEERGIHHDLKDFVQRKRR